MLLLLPLLPVQRIQACKDKGFVAVEPDNVDGECDSQGEGTSSADGPCWHAVDVHLWRDMCAELLLVLCGCARHQEPAGTRV
jgi:hypothetical protein